MRYLPEVQDGGGVVARVWGAAVDVVTYALSTALDALIRAPLAQLYWQGPPLGGYGFWHGTPAADVCASLTRIPASFWESSMDAVTECAILRERQFTSFFVAVSMGVYLCVLYQLVQVLLFRVCVLRPMMQQQRQQRAQVVMLADDGGGHHTKGQGQGQQEAQNNDDDEHKTASKRSRRKVE